MAADASALARSFLWATDPVLWAKDVYNFTPDPWQAKFLSSASRRCILNCCRQSGKSTAVGLRIAHRLTFRRGYFVVCTAPSDRQTLELFQKIREPLQAAGELKETPPKDNLHELVLPNGSRVVCLPANPDTIRGFSKVNEVLFDEAAMIPDSVFTAIEPMIMRAKGSLTQMSTPKGQRGHFHNTWQGGKGWERYTVTYREVLEYGHFTQEDLDQFREEHGEWMFRQEYGCEFLSTIDAVFPLEQVQKSIVQDMDTFAW